VTVVSGMAMGVDSAAHAGTLEAGGATVAALATGADRPYPARARTLHARIAETGCVVSELPPGFEPRRWAFPARNRVIAALSAATVVVEGGERSGSLITADFAAELGRGVGAVPGAVTARLAAGPHALLKAGAELIRDAADVLDLLGAAPIDPRAAGPHGVAPIDPRAPGPHGFAPIDPCAPGPHGPPADPVAAGPTRPGPTPIVLGAGPRARPRPGSSAGAVPPPAELDPRLAKLLARIERGQTSLAELVTDAGEGLTVARDLGELEALGLVRRVFGGRYIRAPG